MKNHHSIQTLCATFNVSASGYYDWRSRLTAPGPRARETHALTQTIKTIHAKSRQTYGSPRIQIELRDHGLPILRPVALEMKAVRVGGAAAVAGSFRQTQILQRDGHKDTLTIITDFCGGEHRRMAQQQLPL